jgi:hypothetical protein
MVPVTTPGSDGKQIAVTLRIAYWVFDFS